MQVGKCSKFCHPTSPGEQMVIEFQNKRTDHWALVQELILTVAYGVITEPTFVVMPMTA